MVIDLPSAAFGIFGTHLSGHVGPQVANPGSERPVRRLPTMTRRGALQILFDETLKPLLGTNALRLSGRMKRGFLVRREVDF
jgi:hypothetical protein